MTTKAELRRLVLSHLTVIDPTDAPSSEQTSMADLFIDGARSHLNELGICWWDADAIPEAVSLPLMRFVSALACSAFGRRGKGYEADLMPARKEIATLKPSEERETIRGDYY